MALIKLIGLSILITLAFRTTHTLEEPFLTSANNKDSGIKTPEKRTNNFRLPVETTFDPNFWPARGRRSRRDPERDPPPENCITSLDKAGLQCQPPKMYERVQLERRAPPDFELYPPNELEDELADKPENNCLESVALPKPNPPGKLGVKIAEALRTNLLTKGHDEFRHKKQRHSGLLPQLVLYGNGVYWEPENLYGEKKKKQDVFWVARGKNFNFPEK